MVTESRKMKATGSLSGAKDAYGYNGRNEVVSARRTLGGSPVAGFNEDFAYDPIGNRVSTTDYDALGRRVSESDPNGLVTTTAYDAEGRVVSKRGATYPVDYEYDAWGDRVAMATYRDAALSQGDVTLWLRDDATGVCMASAAESYSAAIDRILQAQSDCLKCCWDNPL